MSYDLVSRQNITADKPVEDIVLVPSIFRALVFAGTAALLRRMVFSDQLIQTANLAYTPSHRS